MNKTEPDTLPDPLLETARPFGVSYLFPYQRLVITNVLDDADAPEGSQHPDSADRIQRQIVVLPTGAGKTLCFQLPAAVLGGLTVVVYPLNSLMADQLRRAEGAGLQSAILGGGQSRTEREKIWQSISSGELKLILTNPETLSQDRVLNQLADAQISHLVIDEAHCVSEWGETFREAYLELGRVIRTLAPATTTAFTATASPPVLSAVRTHLFGNDGAHLIQAVPDRPNISYSVLQTPAKQFALRSLFGGGRAPGNAGRGDAIGAHPAEASPPHFGTADAPGPASTESPTEGTRPEGPPHARALTLPALVFCRSRKRVESVARTLGEAIGWDRVGAYHAGMSREERTAIEGWFFDADDAVLVATCAYGMGVDKSNIRTAVHYDLPGTVEAFLQESGRGGRDGEPAESVVLFNSDDTSRTREVTDPGRRQRFEQMIGYCLLPGCRRDYLMNLLGAECEACFGCDNCRANAAHGAPLMASQKEGVARTAAILNRATAELSAAAAQTLTFVGKNPRLLTSEQTARILRGRMERGDRWVARRLPGRKTSMTLETWSHAELMELIDGMRSDGVVRSIRYGPWRGRLERVRRHRVKPLA